MNEDEKFRREMMKRKRRKKTRGGFRYLYV